jgi:uncharacterized membrane protein
MFVSQLSPCLGAAAIVLAMTAPSEPADSAATEPAGRFHFEVCNEKTFPIMVAVRYNSDGVNYITHGWWYIPPGPPGRRCQSIAHFRNGDFYFYAQSFNTNPIRVFVVGSDLAQFCVTTTERFTYSGAKTCDASDRRDFSHLVISGSILTWTLQ